MTSSPLDTIINEAKTNLAQQVKTEIKTSEEQTNQIFSLIKDAFIRLLQSEAGVGHFDEFLKIYNGMGSSTAITQLTFLLEHYYAKKIKDSLKLSSLDSEKTAVLISSFVIKKISSKKTTSAKDIKTFCTQMGLESYITDLETFKKKWDDLSPEEKKQYSR